MYIIWMYICISYGCICISYGCIHVVGDKVSRYIYRYIDIYIDIQPVAFGVSF